MNKKYLICSSVLCGFAVTALLLMLIPVLDISNMTMYDLIGNTSLWYNFEDYVWGVGAMILVIILPILIVNCALCILSACGVIKNKRIDKVLYVINIVLTVIVLATIIPYLLGYGRSLSVRKTKLFVGTTYFKYATSYLPLHILVSVLSVFTALINRSKPIVIEEPSKQ